MAGWHDRRPTGWQDSNTAVRRKLNESLWMDVRRMQRPAVATTGDAMANNYNARELYNDGGRDVVAMADATL